MQVPNIVIVFSDQCPSHQAACQFEPDVSVCATLLTMAVLLLLRHNGPLLLSVDIISCNDCI